MKGGGWQGGNDDDGREEVMKVMGANGYGDMEEGGRVESNPGQRYAIILKPDP